MRLFPRLLCIFSWLSLSACSVTSPKMNIALDDSQTKRVPSAFNNQRSEELTIILTFSGGGTRAAALSYGVLDGLRQTAVTINHKPRRLLDEVDLISSVSGGSFTSAYYGLFGDRIFSDFERKFLKKPVQSNLIKLSLLSPKAWVRLLPGLFERSDLAAEYYSRTIFHKKTFADLRKDSPFIVINATDLSLGQGFAFTDYHFRWICSDLGSYPISRAVAASSAVPVLFSPITLENHADKCSSPPPLWNSSGRNIQNKRFEQTLQIRKYRDHQQYKYLHLMDGGIADNLGIRSLLDIASYHDNNMWNAFSTYRLQKTKKMIFIVVNASSFQNPDTAKTRITPSTIDIIDATTSIQSNKYNVETLDLLRSQFPLWKKQIAKGRCARKRSPDCAKIDIDLVEIKLQDLLPEERHGLMHIPTTLELPSATVDRLKSAGSTLLKRSKSYQKLLRELAKNKL